MLEIHHLTLTELSGVDLLVADLKALETYALYFYYLSKIWSKPLPEVYDPESVAEYFSCRPHVVALRLLEVGFNIYKYYFFFQRSASFSWIVEL